MHMLVKGEDKSFSQTVTARAAIRLSGRCLREAPGQPIAEVARACEFESSGDVLSGLSCDRGDAPGRVQGARRSIRGASACAVIDHSAST